MTCTHRWACGFKVKGKGLFDLIKFMCSGAIPGNGVLRYVCHADPDRLQVLAHQAQGAAREQLHSLSQDFSAVLHDMRVGGVWKRTAPGRLPKTEEAMVSRLSNVNTPGTVLDMGASDGSTSADLLQALVAGCGREFQVYMADLYLWLDVWRRGGFVEYRTTDGQPVLVRFGRWGMRLPNSEHRWDVPGTWLAKFYVSLSSFRGKMVHQGRIPMISPLALAQDAIKPVEMNCLMASDAMKDRFDAVRASNILNRDYFSPDQLRQALGHLHGYLHNGGWLVVSRNEGSVDSERENGTVWRRTDRGFDREEDFGAGSEIADVVDGFAADGG